MYSVCVNVYMGCSGRRRGEYLVGFRTQKGIGIGEALALDAGRDLE